MKTFDKIFTFGIKELRLKKPVEKVFNAKRRARNGEITFGLYTESNNYHLIWINTAHEIKENEIISTIFHELAHAYQAENGLYQNESKKDYLNRPEEIHARKLERELYLKYKNYIDNKL